MVFQPDAPDDFGENAAKTSTENPMTNPEHVYEGHTQTDAQLETVGGSNNHNDTEV
jgi:hypothetical protein